MPISSYLPLTLSLPPREEVECDLQFLGLLVMENRLKQETKPIIRQLQDANIRTIMVTGETRGHSHDGGDRKYLIF